MSTGRRPGTENFAASFDFPMERGYIPVDEQYQFKSRSLRGGDVVSGGISQPMQRRQRPKMRFTPCLEALR
ncbi:MAG: hypothetical protein ACLS8R_10080 [Anaeromassilibacillus sp.]